MDKAALDLADVNRSVQRRTHIVQDVHAQHLGLAGERINGHLGAGCAVGKVIERAAAESGFVVMDFGRAVEAIAPELHPLRVGHGDQAGKAAGVRGAMDLVTGKAHRAGAAAVQLRYKLRQPVAHLQRGQLGGAAIQIGASRCRRGAGVGYLIGVAGIDLDPRGREAQNPGHDQRDFGVQALAHLGTAVVDQHAAVGIHMHQGAGLVELRGRKADAELDRCERQSALQGGLHGVPSGDLSAARVVLAAFGKLAD